MLQRISEGSLSRIACRISFLSASVSLDSSSSSTYKGDTIVFSGRLVDSSGIGVANKLVDIEQDIFGGNPTLASPVTDSSGYFTAAWQVDRTGTLQIYSIFEGNSDYAKAESSRITVVAYEPASTTPSSPPPSNLNYHTTSLWLQASSTSTNHGNTVLLYGTLTDETGAGVGGMTLLFKDEDAGSGDDDMGSVTTDSGGYYTYEWPARSMDPFDGVVEVYVIFEGSSEYGNSRSNQVNIQVN